MEYKVYSVYDSAVEAYMQPFCAPTKGQAIRMFTDSVNDPSSELAKHADDYTLFELGSYEDSNGSYVLHIAPMSIGTALEFKRSV